MEKELVLVLKTDTTFEREMFVKDKSQSDHDFLEQYNYYCIEDKFDYKRGELLHLPTVNQSHGEDPELVIQDAVKLAMQYCLVEGRIVHCISGGISLYEEEPAEYLWERGVDLLVVGSDEWYGYKGLWIRIFNATMLGLLERHASNGYGQREFESHIKPFYNKMLYGTYGEN